MAKNRESKPKKKAKKKAKAVQADPKVEPKKVVRLAANRCPTVAPRTTRPPVVGTALRDRVWGPSVEHESTCIKWQDRKFDCSCSKRFYWEGCDAQHWNTKCPRTVLDDMVEAVTFKEKPLRALIEEILDAAEARSMVFYSLNDHLKSRIDELAERHGNLGVTRRRLYDMARKALRRRSNRAYRDRTRG